VRRNALEQLRNMTFDCMVMDLNLPDLSGYELLTKMADADEVSFPPVIVYTGRTLTGDEEQGLRRFLEIHHHQGCPLPREAAG